MPGRATPDERLEYLEHRGCPVRPSAPGQTIRLVERRVHMRGFSTNAVIERRLCRHFGTSPSPSANRERRPTHAG